MLGPSNRMYIYPGSVRYFITLILWIFLDSICDYVKHFRIM